jgi:sugar/nucleoside kinase (ribokinase family)
MTAARHDVVAIGNAIVDIIGRCDEAFLARHGASKGHMQLVDADTASKLYAEMGPAIEISGGSAANTMVGLASLGGKAAFIGKVAGDEFGRIFRHDITAAGVKFDTGAINGKAPTSRSLILVTPDGERTMNTFLGISTDLDGGEVDPEVIRGSAIVYLEGYLFDRPEAKEAFRQAAAIARGAGRRVALTLSDSFCVDRHRAEFLQLIRNGIDILFANESEITSLYETSSFDEAARRAASDLKLAVLTRSARGSMIFSEGATPVSVPAAPVAKVVDTTGAGDLYAAGFLYGLSAGHNLATCGRLGSLAAAEIISHIGARPETNLAALARQQGFLS